MSTFVIAEAGSCHDGKMYRAVDLIRAAKAAGANAVKFQWWSNPVRLAERRNAFDYLSVYAKYAISEEWLRTLYWACNDYSIEFMCTVYLPEDIELIDCYVRRFKIASFEAGDKKFVKAHYKYKKPIIISTGMSEHYDPPYSIYHSDTRISLLHCVSSYPTPVDQINLGAIRSGYHHFMGLSDHTKDVLTGALAVAAGAKILEVHFRLHDTDPKNPDYTTALSPSELTDYISLVRKAELMMGTGEKVVQECEKSMTRYKVK